MLEIIKSYTEDEIESWYKIATKTDTELKQSSQKHTDYER